MTLETSFEMFELFADPERDQDALAPSGQWPGDRQFDITSHRLKTVLNNCLSPGLHYTHPYPPGAKSYNTLIVA
jgi:hypothetical protein